MKIIAPCMLASTLIGIHIGTNNINDNYKQIIEEKNERIEMLETKIEEAEPYLLYKIEQQILKEQQTLEWMAENE